MHVLTCRVCAHCPTKMFVVMLDKHQNFARRKTHTKGCKYSSHVHLHSLVFLFTDAILSHHKKIYITQVSTNCGDGRKKRIEKVKKKRTRGKHYFCLILFFLNLQSIACVCESGKDWKEKMIISRRGYSFFHNNKKHTHTHIYARTQNNKICTETKREICRTSLLIHKQNIFWCVP